MSEKLFVFGTSKNVFAPYGMLRLIQEWVAAGNSIIIGDAPGIDTSIQEFLSSIGAKDVTVYTTHDKPRFIIPDMNWNVVVADVPEEAGETAKDMAMCDACDRAICAILINGSIASRKNIVRLKQAGKNVKCFYL